MVSLEGCALSDVGRARRFNEDFFAIDNQRQLYLVADGMGGHGHGEVASRLVVQVIREAFQEAGRKRGGTSRKRQLHRAIDLANQRVLGAADKNRSLTGMGTTLVALLGEEDRLLVAHVGDSRAYRMRRGRLEQLTEDHTWVNEQMTAGNLSASQARDHPFKSVVTRALGGDQEVKPEIRELEPVAGDLYLLCSDGLNSMLPDEEIERRLASGEPPDRICQRLVRDANDRGGRDNITVLLVAVR